MTKITLAQPWTYRTPLVTIDFPAGAHEVDEAIAAAAPPLPEPELELEAVDGDHPATPRAPRTARAPKG
ncbi:hypothetical protein GTZ99_12450 [Novosphingobium sp. FSY-8]|uniref:Uncharacterized protein n=1 Tax=Novosphingobium ovatum TaxID=1908523 RepID=A0ABW9XFS4_9SPHN|nr:hypothetical protein [Novosphingobium ovatum]NBC37361.1 hypothetical protein [Novosphingobium ovatum]